MPVVAGLRGDKRTPRSGGPGGTDQVDAVVEELFAGVRINGGKTWVAVWVTCEWS